MNLFFTLLSLSILLFALDTVYLYTMQNVFIDQIAAVQGSPLQLNLVGALLCYILLVGGLYYFIIKDKRSILDAFLLGIVVYGVYGTTNMAIIKKWKYQTVITDIVWGGILFASTTYIFFKYIT
jgi:uncharacterized membrane protein